MHGLRTWTLLPRLLLLGGFACALCLWIVAELPADGPSGGAVSAAEIGDSWEDDASLDVDSTPGSPSPVAAEYEHGEPAGARAAASIPADAPFAGAVARLQFTRTQPHSGPPTLPGISG